LQDTENAFLPLYESNGFFKTLGEYERPFILVRKNIITTISLNNLFQNWYETISEFFTLRHKVVHDANYRVELTNSFISQAESICIILPQIIGLYVSEKYGISRSVFHIENKVIKSASVNEKNEIGYLFTVQDMIAKDWIIVDS
jgi:hypothetical protein